MIYYAEFEYFTKYDTYTSNLSDLGLKAADFPKNLDTPVIHSTRTTFESFIPVLNGNQEWTIYQDGRILNLMMKVHGTK